MFARVSDLAYKALLNYSGVSEWCVSAITSFKGLSDCSGRIVGLYKLFGQIRQSFHSYGTLVALFNLMFYRTQIFLIFRRTP